MGGGGGGGGGGGVEEARSLTRDQCKVLDVRTEYLDVWDDGNILCCQWT